MRPVVSIIIVTVDTPRMTSACLRSVCRNSTLPHELIIVNNSRAHAIRRCLHSLRGIRIIQNPGNLGFAKAANRGALAARGEYLCFLNTDTLVPPRWLERLVEAAEQPRVGAVGPASQIGRNLVLRKGPPPTGLVREAMTALADEATQRMNGNGTSLQDVPRLFGYCLLIPRAVMTRVGPFDEGYFFEKEDEDYCIRLRRKGYRLVRVRSLFVHHRGGTSSDPRRRRRWAAASRAYFRRKWK